MLFLPGFPSGTVILADDSGNYYEIDYQYIYNTYFTYITSPALLGRPEIDLQQLADNLSFVKLTYGEDQ